ncbi:hypothetical protein SAMN05428989_3095 [Pseudoxanthomonas sp. GM95]|uniref:hypothetical protein n=1 Tax=Pseudoxanthomonas sp. GM95 TaxID=1881043 RepID=UPI0008C98FB8|nr:hypothetical protein [Pseudoxanthomonas sp. GM95]SEM11666.1 hypothetical protein SAMN05428989_3095 [Pseudoxanthomonas sp. GM95]
MNAPASSSHPPLSKTTLLSIVEALEARFDAAAWAALGVELDIPALGDPEMGFQTALRHGDDDFGYQVAQFVTLLESDHRAALRALAGRPALGDWLQQHAPNAARELALGEQVVQPEPARPSAGEIARGTPNEAGHTSNPPVTASPLGVARAALRRDLLAACAKAGLTMTANASTGMLFNAIRSVHPALVTLAQDAPQMDLVLGSLALAVTAIDALSNLPSAQAAHAPLGESEVALMTEVMHALSGYVQARL